MFKKAIALTAITASLFVGAVSPVYANNVPEFGSCVNPQWSQTQVNTLTDPNGPKHGVVGVASFIGTDTIYKSGSNAMQCLCTDTGEGYQTNWLKASYYSHDQIESMKAQGWIYVPEGQDWGLEKGPYLAKNASYTCTVCTPTPTGTVTPTPTSVPGPTPTPGVTTQVQGASANNSSSSNNSGLASTGNALVIYVSLIAGAAALILGMVLRKFSK